MNKKNILFITEGKIDEPKFIEKVFNICYPSIKYDVYSYSTTIHTLATLIFKTNGEIDEYLNIRNFLKEVETNKEKLNILSKNYSDIFLVFDFEPHTDAPEFEKINKMLQFFNDSSNNGKLFINYPMMQSYKHLKSLPDEEFKNKKIYIIDTFKYKQIVNNESCCKNLYKYTYLDIMNIISHHLKKANYILNSKYIIPDKETYLNFNLNKLYNIQVKNKEEKEWIYILNTFVFNIIDYNPTKTLEKIKEICN